MRIRQAVVTPGVGDPDVRIAARVQADAAAQGQVVTDAPGESESRHQQVEAIDVGVVTQATIGIRKRLVEARAVAGREELVAQAGNDSQVVAIEEDLVLDVQRVKGVREVGRCIVGVVGSTATAVIDAARPAQLEAVDAGRLATVDVVHPLLRGQQCARRVVAIGVIEEIVLAATRVLHEQVEDLEVFAIVAGGDDVITDEVVR